MEPTPQPSTKNIKTSAHEIARFLKNHDKMKVQSEQIDSIVQPV